MKKNLLTGTVAVMLLAASFVSCKKENHSATTPATLQNADVVNYNGRLQFKNSAVLSKTIQSLINQSPDYLNTWETGLNFSSLRKDTAAAAKFSSFGFPDFYESILNSKGEYMIGDTIVYFNNGYKYFVPNKNEALLAKIKADPNTAALKFPAGNSVILSTTNNTNASDAAATTGTHLTTSLNNNYTDARYQYQFHKDGDPNSQRKIVFEVQNLADPNNLGGYTCYFHTRIKQEYLGGNKAGNWLPAGEVMEKSFSNLSYNVAFINTGNGATTHVTGAGINASQTDGTNLDRTLVTFQASQSGVTASVSGNYHAKVIPAGNSAGHYDVNPATW